MSRVARSGLCARTALRTARRWLYYFISFTVLLRALRFTALTAYFNTVGPHPTPSGDKALNVRGTCLAHSSLAVPTVVMCTAGQFADLRCTKRGVARTTCSVSSIPCVASPRAATHHHVSVGEPSESPSASPRSTPVEPPPAPVAASPRPASAVRRTTPRSSSVRDWVLPSTRNGRMSW